jgi:hypothetical protein
MPPKDFVSITVSRAHADRLQKVREHLVKHGADSAPEEFRPEDHDSITAGTVIEMALRGLEHALKMRGAKKVGAAGAR